MFSCNVHLSESGALDAGAFKLLELPPDLSNLIESLLSNDTPPSYSFSIKGDIHEDAVLCTENKTYTIRSVALSNSILVTTPPSDATAGALSENAVVIKDTVKEILELIPSVPRLHKLILRLRGREYQGQEEDILSDVRRYTYEDARNEIQASKMELDSGLRRSRILQLNGELRPISVAYLADILQVILNLLVSLSMPHSRAPIETLIDPMVHDHEILRSVAIQVMEWFGEIRDDGNWVMNVGHVIKELGLSILRDHRHQPIAKSLFLQEWKGLIGDTFENDVQMDLLAGNYVMSGKEMEALSYFPAFELPTEPAARFRDLFLTRPRWKVEDITPYLNDIAVDVKERDRLLLKYARGVTDAEGLWYTGRSQYTG